MNHDRPAMFASAGAAKDNFDGQHDAIAGFRNFVACDSVEKEAGCDTPQFLRRLANHGKRGRTEFGQIEVVETDQGHIVRHFHAEAEEGGENIARGERI